jgi:cobalt-zinc-cadmium efflux system protein
MHVHAHGGDHHGHGSQGSRNALLAALTLTLGYAGIEAIAGWWAGSLALMGDAAHMLTDSLALGLALAAALLAARPPSPRLSFGLGRLEPLAALANALLMIGLVAVVSAEAVERLQDPQPVRGAAVAGVAFVGLLVNIGAAWLLAGGRQNLNVRAALLHVLGDLLGSVAALISGVVILYTEWLPIDPILSLVIAVLILLSSLQVLREALHSLMEGVPLHLDLEAIGHAMAEVEGVKSVHDLHVWSLSASRYALSAHIVVLDLRAWEEILGRLQHMLHQRFGIDHATLQPETPVQRIALETLRRGRSPDIP